MIPRITNNRFPRFLMLITTTLIILLATTQLATTQAAPPMQDPPTKPAADPNDTQSTQPQQQEADPDAIPPTPTPHPIVPSIQGAFRTGPTIALRPVNDVISWNQDGLVEVLFRNPILNDLAMEVELSVSIPSGFHLYGDGLATDVAAGTASAHYVVAPGHSRTIYLSIKAAKTGQTTIHFSANYWPADNKDLFNPISLSHPFTVTEASSDPLKPPSNTGKPEESGPAASCALGSMATGDMVLLSLGLIGMTGMVFVRRRRS